MQGNKPIIPVALLALFFAAHAFVFSPARTGLIPQRIAQHDGHGGSMPTTNCTQVTTTTTPWTLDENLRAVIPQDMMLIESSLLWCPNAKSGTTTVYEFLGENKLLNLTGGATRCFRKGNCTMLASNLMKNWASAKPLSFVIVRNPYDRIRSGFLDKIKSGRLRARDERGGPVKSFAKFVDYVEQNPMKNIHWMPVSSRCLTGPGGGTFQYDYILKLDEDDIPQKLGEIFRRAGISLPAGIGKEPSNVNTEHSSKALIDFYREAAAEGNMTLGRLVAKVGGIYRDDIESFGYSFPEHSQEDK